MSLPALMPLMPTLPASAQPSEGQPPLPPVELPDEMASRDSVDGRGRAMFIPRGEESGQASDSLRREPSESSGPRSRAIPVNRTTQVADAGVDMTPRKPGVVLSPAGINPRLLAMAFTQPIIRRLLENWSEGRTVSLSIPANPGLPEPLAKALAQAASPALMKAILAVGMRQDGVVLAAQPAAQTLGTPLAEASQPKFLLAARGEPIPPNASIALPASTDDPGGAVNAESTPADTPAASTGLTASTPSIDAKRDTGNLPMTVSLTLLPLPVQPDRFGAEREQNQKRGGQKDGDTESGASSVSRRATLGRMLRGEIDLGPRGRLNFEIRSLNGRFSVALGATPDLGAAARPVLPALEEALHRLPGFTELHWNG